MPEHGGERGAAPPYGDPAGTPSPDIPHMAWRGLGLAGSPNRIACWRDTVLLEAPGVLTHSSGAGAHRRRYPTGPDVRLRSSRRASVVWTPSKHGHDCARIGQAFGCPVRPSAGRAN